MTVKEMMQKINDEELGDMDFCDDYDERAYVAYCEGTLWTPKAEEKYARAFNLEIYDFNAERGDCGVLVKCEDGKDAQALADLLYGMAGYIPESEYDELFYTEPVEYEPEPVRQMFEIVLTDGRVLKANRIDMETLYRPIGSNPWEGKSEIGFAVHTEDGDCIPIYADQVVRIIGKVVGEE